ncbi:MAG: nickel pincer cofactor biosynthesis protein LarC [Nitrospinae bacterium]|nr:nickel pincer cofactor biosynthesis protein LarC [Nitrospinota bacterium]
MKIAYFDCFSGISGDMILGAMVDAGIDIESIRGGLKSLDFAGYEISVSKVKRKGIAGTKVDIIIDEKKHVHHRDYKDIKGMIEKSGLSEIVKENSLKIFERIAEAEAKVHNTSIDNVHFHELGAVDTIIDVVGAALCINLLAPDKIIASPINTGRGMTKTEHGIFPVPAPATAEMLKGFPSFLSDTEFELATPTGVGIITTVAKGVYSTPVMKAQAIGYGAGSMEIPESPNLLRVMIGETIPSIPFFERGGVEGFEHDSVIVIETNIDDMNPQFYDHVINKIFEGGALDVFLTPIIMKKNRPAVKITTLSHNDSADRLVDILLRETTSFGLRMYRTERIKLQREIKSIETGYGNAKIKIGKRDGKVISIAPEYEDCKRIATESGISIKEAYEIVRSAGMRLYMNPHP